MQRPSHIARPLFPYRYKYHAFTRVLEPALEVHRLTNATFHSNRHGNLTATCSPDFAKYSRAGEICFHQEHDPGVRSERGGANSQEHPPPSRPSPRESSFFANVGRAEGRGFWRLCSPWLARLVGGKSSNSLKYPFEFGSTSTRNEARFAGAKFHTLGTSSSALPKINIYRPKDTAHGVVSRQRAASH